MTKQSKTQQKMKTIQQLYENKKLRIDDLYQAKQQLKQKIDVQQQQVLTSFKQVVPFSKALGTLNLGGKMLSPMTLITFLFRRGKTFSILNGILTGFKLMKAVRKLMRR